MRKFDPYRRSDTFKAHLKQLLSIKEDDFVIAFTGRFVGFKGFHIVIKAFNTLVNNYKANLKLILIGGEDPIHPTGLTPDEYAEFRNNEDIIKIDFTHEVDQYLAIADLFVFPSEKEGMPVCIMEALAMGVPVVTANSRGCNDLVQHDFNGLLLSDDPTPSETREAILRLYRDRSLLNRFSENALSKRSAFNRELYVRDQIEVYSHANDIGTYKYA